MNVFSTAHDFQERLESPDSFRKFKKKKKKLLRKTVKLQFHYSTFSELVETALNLAAEVQTLHVS